MGQKIHPTGFRLAVSRNWASRWYAGNSNFATMLNEDLKVREYLKKKLKNASVGRVGFWLTNFFDIHMNRHAHHFGQCGFQHFNVFTLFTDHDTWTRAVNSDAGILRWTLDDDATN